MSAYHEESPKNWVYEEDTGTMMCKCPVCKGRMIIDRYCYSLGYKFCPFCGEKLGEGEFERKRKMIYG